MQTILDVTVKTWKQAQAYTLDTINGENGYTVTRMSMGIDKRVGYCLERDGKVVARIGVDPAKGSEYK